MNTILKQISPQTIALLEENSKRMGISIDEYLQSILPKNEKDLGLKMEVSEAEFESDMNTLAEENLNSYQGSYSREDIYFDHN